MTKDDIGLFVPIISGLFGFVGAWIGAQLALNSFRKQRAFDKQLDWYERAARAIYGLAEKIEIACTHEDPPESPIEHRKEAWIRVQSAHLVLGRMANESHLFGSSTAISRIEAVDKRVQKIAEETEAFDPHALPPSRFKKAVQDISELSVYLTKSARPLLAEGRTHLGIEHERSQIRHLFGKRKI
jgi:hypothetical protein